MATDFYYGYEYSPTTFNVSPAPIVEITQNPFYAGENLIGYNYTVVLNGKAYSNSASVQNVFVEIEKIIQKIFNKNGAILYVEYDGNAALRCIGSKVVSIEIIPTDNQWVNFADYTVTIEFNEIEFFGCESNTITCPDIIATNYTPNLVDPKTHKIKSFSDSWDIQAGQEMYQAVGREISNQYYSVTYTIEAEGYHYFQSGTDTTTRQYLIPGWEQAKNFCQKRLFDQVDYLIPRILMERGVDSSNSNDPIAGSNPSNLFGSTGVQTAIDVDPTKFDIFNEKIKTTTSEAEGKFTLEYSCILKNIYSIGSLLPDHSNVLHIITTTKTVNDNKSNRQITLEVAGEIQGLMPGGLHQYKNPSQLQLKQNGVLIVGLNSTLTKYDYAKQVYNSIYGGNGNKGFDLSDSLKNYLGITYAVFEVDCESNNTPVCSNLNSSHNFSEGKITYSASYDSASVCRGRIKFTEVNAVLEDKVEPIAEFVIPGRIKGPIIQKMNTETARSMSININGFMDKDCCYDFALYGESNCPNSSPSLLNDHLPSRIIQNAILTEDNTTINPLDGSFSVSRKYVYYDI